MAQVRKCEAPGFSNLRSPLTVDKAGLSYLFCPGKATHYPEIIELFDSCRVAYTTGIMPKAGGLEDQDGIFTEVFPAFTERWRERMYNRWWGDISEFTNNVLKAIFGKGN